MWGGPQSMWRAGRAGGGGCARASGGRGRQGMLGGVGHVARCSGCSMASSCDVCGSELLSPCPRRPVYASRRVPRFRSGVVVSLSAQSGGGSRRTRGLPIRRFSSAATAPASREIDARDLERVWSGWVSRRAVPIRMRLDWGDELAVTFCSSGTRSPLPRANDSTKLGGPSRPARSSSRRIGDPLRVSRRREPTNGCNLPGVSWNAGASIRKRPQVRRAPTSSRS